MDFDRAYPHATELTFLTPVPKNKSLHLCKFVTYLLKMCTKEFNDE